MKFKILVVGPTNVHIMETVNQYTVNDNNISITLKEQDFPTSNDLHRIATNPFIAIVHMTDDGNVTRFFEMLLTDMRISHGRSTEYHEDEDTLIHIDALISTGPESQGLTQMSIITEKGQNISNVIAREMARLTAAQELAMQQVAAASAQTPVETPATQQVEAVEPITEADPIEAFDAGLQADPVMSAEEMPVAEEPAEVAPVDEVAEVDTEEMPTMAYDEEDKKLNG